MRWPNDDSVRIVRGNPRRTAPFGFASSKVRRGTAGSPNRALSRFGLFRTAAALFVFLLGAGVSFGVLHGAPDVGNPSAPKKDPARQTFPVELRGREILRFEHGVAFVGPEERARLVRDRLARVLREGQDPTKIEVKRVSGEYLVVLGESVLVQITIQDARSAGVSRGRLAELTRERFERQLIEITRERNRPGLLMAQRQLSLLRSFFANRNLDRIFVDVVLALALILMLLLVGWVTNRIFNATYSRLEIYQKYIVSPLRFRNLELLSAKQLGGVFLFALRTLHLAVLLFLIYLFSDWILFLFPDSQELDVKTYVRGVIYAGLVTVVAHAVYRAGRDLFDAMRNSSALREGRLLKELKFQNTTLISEDRLVEAIDFFIGVVRLFFVLLIFYIYLVVVLSFFPVTRGVTDVLFGYLAAPLKKIGLGVLGYIPNLFFVAVIGVIAFYGNRFVRAFFTEVERGRIRVPGFYRDWAVPTHRIITFLIIAFSAVVVFPYLPGSESDAFKGISIFLGFVVSLSSSTVLANVIAGLVVTYTRPFAVGDRVRIADTVGDVTATTLLVTRVRTVKNVEITIPNGMVLGSHIINYSTGAKKEGVILHTSVTIGYDVPYEKVERMLARAARETDFIRDDPAPFVLQKSLDDFYVNYEVNAFTDHPEKMERIYSGLHRSIQRIFFENGVEILSPHYRAVRGGAEAAIPAGHVPDEYVPPAIPVSFSGSGFAQADGVKRAVAPQKKGALAKKDVSKKTSSRKKTPKKSKKKTSAKKSSRK